VTGRSNARECLLLCPKGIKTHLRVSVISKNFPGVIPRTPFIKGRGEIGYWRLGMEGRNGKEGRWMGGKVKGRRGRGKEEQERIVKDPGPPISVMD
jgi:hypothetical protein